MIAYTTITRLLCLCACAAAAVVAQDYDIDAEISRARRELSRIEEERKKVAEAAERDRQEFAQYQQRTEARMRGLAAETDSVRSQIAVFSGRSDSLGSKLGGMEARTREYSLLQDRLRARLVGLCDEQITLAGILPPSVSKQSTASLSFLRSELASKSIDNVEGLSRLFTVLNDMELQLMDIQILQGVSPVADIAGTAYRLRIGGVFEAVVDAKGQKCAVWSGDSLRPWRLVEDAEVAGRILKAINVREGKTIPAMVELPFAPAHKGAGHE